MTQAETNEETACINPSAPKNSGKFEQSDGAE